MARFHHILFPTDFSQRCDGFSAEVGYIARQMQAEVTMAHAVQGYRQRYRMGAADCALRAAGAGPERQMAEDAVREFTQNTGVAAAGVILEGDPAGAVCKYIQRHGVDLIMMPTNGCGATRRVFRDGLASRLLSAAPCALLTTAHEDSIPGHIPCVHMLCALGLDSESARLLRAAAETADSLAAELQIVHAVTGADEHDASGEGSDFFRFLMNTAVQTIAELQASLNTKFQAIVRPGKITSVIASAAAETHADLIAIGRGSLHKVLGRVRTHTFEIVNNAHCCVLAL